MTNLIINEFTKIFKRKNIYILFAVVFGFVLLTGILTKKAEQYTVSSSYYYSDIDNLESELAKLNPEDNSEVSHYISLKTEIEIQKTIQKYGYESWQARIAPNQISQAYYELYSSIYETKDNNARNNAQAKVDALLKRLTDNDWRSFAEEEKKDLENQVQTLKANIASQKNKTKDLEIQLKNTELNLEIINYRLEKNIDYSSSSLNNALDEYNNSMNQIINSENQDKITYQDKVYMQEMQQNAASAKYAIENEETNMYETNLRSMLLSGVNNNIFIIILVILFIGGSIISEEFSKGTIKLLLVKPYTRTQILTAKFITALLMIPITYIVLILSQLIVGGLLFGFESLSIPAIAYNFTSQKVEVMSIFKMVFLQIVASLPQLILLITLAFALSTIFTNTAVAIVLPLMGMVAAEIINQLVIAYDIEIMKYFVTLNWDTAQYLFGKLPKFEHINLTFSNIINSIYFLILIIPTYIVFKKKNIKNI